MRAAIYGSMHLARWITPENHFLAQSGDSNWLSFNFDPTLIQRTIDCESFKDSPCLVRLEGKKER